MGEFTPTWTAQQLACNRRKALQLYLRSWRMKPMVHAVTTDAFDDEVQIEDDGMDKIIKMETVNQNELHEDEMRFIEEEDDYNVEVRGHAGEGKDITEENGDDFRGHSTRVPIKIQSYYHEVSECNKQG